MKADEKDGLYDEELFSYDDMKRCAEFWSGGHIEEKYFKEFIQDDIKHKKINVLRQKTGHGLVDFSI